jgi:hypothetical protein
MTSRLASLLVQEGLVAPKQMADAFQRQVIYGGTLDTILLEMNAVPEAALVGALARATSLPPGDTPSIDKLKQSGALQWYPAATAEKFRAVPFTVEGQIVRVLTIDPPDRRALDELGLQLGRAIEAAIVPEHRFVHAMAAVYDTPVPARFQSLQARLLRRANQAGAATSPSPSTSTSTSTSASPPSSPSSSPFPTSTAARPVVTDLPMPGAPVAAHDEQPTPRLTTRELAAPTAPVAREVAKPQPVSPAGPAATAVSNVDTSPLRIEQAIAAIDEARDRDEIFAALCRGARSRAEYVALFTVHAETLVGRVALADVWIDRTLLASVSMSLDAPTPLRTASLSKAPLVGKVGEDTVSKALLESLGRKAPTLAALLPIVLRDRTVALLYADSAGKAMAKEAMGELSNGAAAAARAFQRLILAAKGQDFKTAGDGKDAKVECKLSVAKSGATALGAIAAQGAWRTGGDSVGKLSEDTARHSAPVVQGDPEVLFTSVERGDDKARDSADKLVSLGARGAEMAVARLPGPIRIDRGSYRGLTPPLADHGPICGLVARFGNLAVPALERRVNEGSADVRYYVTLALGELAREASVPQLAARVFDRDPSVRKVAVDMLIRMPASDARTALVESLRGDLPGPDRERQRISADALGALGDAHSVPRLIELVKHEDTAVQSAARKALLSITKQDYGTSRWRWRGWWDRHKNEAREEWLFEGLGHSEDDVRASAAEELKRMYSEHFGYHWDAPKREREEARKRWHEWYRARK